MSPHSVRVEERDDRVCVDESGRVCVDEGGRVSRAKASCSRAGARLSALLRTRPWLHWVFVYVVTVVYFLCYRLSALTAYVLMFGSKRDNTFGVKFSGVLLGFAEDVVCVNYLALVLWCFDSLMRHTAGIYRFAKGGKSSDDDDVRPAVRRTLSIAKYMLRFIVYLLSFVVIAAPVVANNLMIRLRQMRFTLEYSTMYLNEKDAASGFVVPDYEIHAAYRTIAITATVALFFSIVGAIWIDLSLWTPLDLAFSCCRRCSDEPESEDTLTPIERQQLLQGTPVNSLDASSDFTDLEQQTEASPSSPQKAAKAAKSGSDKKILFVVTKAQALKLQSRLKTQWWRVLLAFAIVVAALVVLPYIVLEITQHSVSAAVAGVALNTSLSEFFRLMFAKECLPGLANGNIDSAAFFLDGTSEEYSLFEDDVLYRRTTGFKGDLAFDLEVDQANLPNVLVIAVESFRYHDSQYLVGEEHKYLLKNQNITVTPNFDRWAKRGIAFRNFWSSWRTSRSVESILFGQLPYDSATTSGTTGGSEDVKLSGMPQLFKAKGYEAVFTAGCRTDYDGWHDFLLTHGFDDILDMVQFKKIAEKELGINPKDWAQVADGGKARAMSYWGVHDDVALDVLGNILVNKTSAQKQRMKKSEPKKPFFINHYTISSHGPFGERPQWYEKYPKPDFSKLVEGEKYPIAVQDYVDMRYFTDMALGKFLDRMEKEGVLNDTIIFITGDHGQAPEAGFTTPESREVSATRVAATMIAEGRLGKYAGMVFDDAAEQYDLLNTFADIVGLPAGGLEQTGVGRSLKRKIPFGQRVVWSNNPNRKMSVVRGHERLQYDVMSNGVFLHNADSDHDMQHDLFDAQTPEQQDLWITLRNAGRKANAYFKKRWRHSCLLKVNC